MSFSEIETNEMVGRAANEILRAREAGERVAVTVIAREFGVDHQRVRRCLKGVGSRASRKPANYRLSAVQEGTLIKYIKTLDEIRVGLHLDHLFSTANAILKQDHTSDSEPPTVSQTWPYRFLQRHPEVYKMKQKPIELARKLAYDPVVIQNWFERF
jgi:Tc5 transposase DNA-binding domain